MIGALLGFWSFFAAGPRPRLIVRRSEDEQVLLAIRKSSGLMYDSRRVYDGRGVLIAHIRSHFKTSVRGGFGIIDLRGLKDDGADIGDRPWLGCVEESKGVYRLRLVGDRDAGRIAREDPPPLPGSPARCDIEASPGLQGDEVGQFLLLAAALAIVWWPPQG